MRTVDVNLKFEAAESLLEVVRGAKIPEEMRDYLARALENAIREAAAPEGGESAPRYVGEHGEDDV
ncbi:hypothetical protein NUH88_08000 [Nisaea acidiphila]|uniref:Uncharacterized protein n=1 Tax=Nisaea acidiphila TaxID=1862145 RepID=A0A9J7AWX8_9PROT|nr:hypothetical protein [Nisaea acidiphila]UUX51630.1 hypothetical protein NUH88_08000 [Nisaea acidiphila]